MIISHFIYFLTTKTIYIKIKLKRYRNIMSNTGSAHHLYMIRFILESLIVRKIRFSLNHIFMRIIRFLVFMKYFE